MIADQNRLKSFQKAIGYDLRKAGAFVIDSNMAGAPIGVVTPEMLAPTVKLLTREFKLFYGIGPKLSRPAYHTSLSAADGEVLPLPLWRTVARLYVRGMGFGGSQWIAVRHPHHDPLRDKKKDPGAHKDHIHLTANFKTPDGKVVSDSNNFARSERILRRIEKKLGLRIVLYSRDSNQSAPTINEIRAAERKAEEDQVIAMPPRVWIQQVVEAALNQKPSDLESFCKLLEADGVSVHLNQQSTGRVAGISFESDMIAFSGSSVGRKFTWLALQKRGLSYDPVRDAEAIYSRSRGAGRDRAGSEIANRHDGVEDERGVDEIARTGEPNPIPGTAPITGRTNDGIRRNAHSSSPNNRGDLGDETVDFADRENRVGNVRESGEHRLRPPPHDDLERADDKHQRVATGVEATSGIDSEIKSEPIAASVPQVHDRDGSNVGRLPDVERSEPNSPQPTIGEKRTSQSADRANRERIQQTYPSEESGVSGMVESKLKPGLMALATRIVEKAITDAPPNAVFELRFSRDRGRLRTKGGLSREKLRTLIRFIAQLLAAAFQVVVDYAVPPGSASGDVLESKESELKPRARKAFPDKEEIR